MRELPDQLEFMIANSNVYDTESIRKAVQELKRQPAEIERLTAERDRFKEQHKLCLDEIESLRREVDAACVLLHNDKRDVAWTPDGYYLRGKLVGQRMMDVIKAAAEQKEGNDG